MNLFRPRYVDGQTVDIEGLTVRLRVSGRASRVSLRVDRARGEAIAVAPTLRHLADAVAFARGRRAWLVERLAETPAAAPRLEAGAELRVFDLPWRLRPDGRRPRLIERAGAHDCLLAGCGLGAVDPQLVARAVRREAITVYGRRAAVHCVALGVPVPPISLTDARSRWGSCTPPAPGRAGAIRLSWRLALAPMAVADYVVAHECAHLVEANHGPRFWERVRTMVGDVRPYRAWLRTEGPALHALLPKPGGQSE